MEFIGLCGIGEKNERGNALIDFVLEGGFFLFNPHMDMSNVTDSWICSRSYDGRLVQIDFVLGASQFFWDDVWYDFGLPIGLDHRCVHCKLRCFAGTRDPFKKHRPSTSNPWSRMATARRPVIPPQLPPRTPQPSRPRQPSLAGFPVWTARQPCVHHDPLWPRHNIPTAYLPNPALETPPSRLTSVSSPLSVPSHSRSLGRPPFSLCPGRGTSIPRSPTRKSSRQSLPRSRRPRDYQHTTHGLKHRQHPAAR